MLSIRYLNISIKLAVDSPTETLQARSKWQEIFQVMKSKVLQPTLLYPARLSFKMEGEIRSFSDKRRLKEYASTKQVLQDMLKGQLKKMKEWSEKERNMGAKGRNGNE